MLKKLNDIAVSPIVGVMLLLVVTIIIAAVASGFAGGLMDNTGKAPELTMDVHIKNNGYWTGSEFSARVLGVDKAIPTSDLKIVTSWTHVSSSGVKTSGGATVMPGINNSHILSSTSSGNGRMRSNIGVSPLGYGIGYGDKEGSGSGSSGKNFGTREFGDYDLAIGTVMWAEPYGASARPTGGGFSGISYNVGYGVAGNRWNYTTGIDAKNNNTAGLHAQFIRPSDNEPMDPMMTGGDGANTYDLMMAVLGNNWYVLHEGDIVTVSIVHTPSGKTIWEKDVIVEG